MPPNKQLQRTVILRRGDGTSAPFHYALVPRFTRQRAAAELRRYAAVRLPLRQDAVLNTIIAAFWLAVLAIVAGCERQPIDRTEGISQENKAVVRQWIEEGFNRRNLVVVDELFAEQFAVNGQTIGRDGLKMSMSQHLTGFPDLHVTIDEILAEESKVGIWYTVEGTHRGEFEGIPATGNRVKWSGFDLLTLEHGKISEARFLSDFFGLMTQLGAKPQNPEAESR